MSFRAKVLSEPANRQLAAGSGGQKTIDGVTFTGEFETYEGVLNEKFGFGAPTPAQLADDTLLIETLEGEPWPGSAGDRLVTEHQQKRGAIGGRYLMRSMNGLWPTENEKRLQKNAHAFFANPEGYARAAMEAYGMKPDSPEYQRRLDQVRSGRRADGFLDIAARVEETKPAKRAAASGS